MFRRQIFNIRPQIRGAVYKFAICAVCICAALTMSVQLDSGLEANAQNRDYKTIKKTHTLVVIECLRGIRRQFSIKKDEETGEWVYRKYRKRRVSRIGRLLCA